MPILQDIAWWTGNITRTIIILEESDMAKVKAKRQKHRQDSDKLNKTALWIGCVIAGMVLGVIVVSVIQK